MTDELKKIIEQVINQHCMGLNFVPKRVANDIAEAIAAWNTRADPWQPIETAPKDGTRVLVWRPRENRDRPAHMDVDRWSDKYSGSWWQSRPGQQPTHWMPRPAPPVSEAPS